MGPGEKINKLTFAHFSPGASVRFSLSCVVLMRNTLAPENGHSVTWEGPFVSTFQNPPRCLINFLYGLLRNAPSRGRIT